MLNEFATTDAVVEPKPSMKIYLEKMHIRREIDGRVNVPNSVESGQQDSAPPARSDAELERLRMENEKLRSDLQAQKNEISVLRGERDSLMKTISKLDVELTEAEYQRTSQVPKGKK